MWPCLPGCHLSLQCVTSDCWVSERKRSAPASVPTHPAQDTDTTDAVREKMTELELVICELSLRLQLRLKLSFCPLVQTGQNAGDVNAGAPSLSFRLTAPWSIRKSSSMATFHFDFQSKTLRKLFVLFNYFLTWMSVLRICHTRKFDATQKSCKTSSSLWSVGVFGWMVYIYYTSPWMEERNRNRTCGVHFCVGK